MSWKIRCFFFNVDTSDESYSTEKLERIFVWSATNDLLNNFVFGKMIVL